MPEGPLRGRCAPEAFQEEELPAQPSLGAGRPVEESQVVATFLMSFTSSPRSGSSGSRRDARLRRQKPGTQSGRARLGFFADTGRFCHVRGFMLLILAQFLQVLEKSRLPRWFCIF